MQNLSRIVGIAGVLVLTNLLTPVFAESAPVYDADSMQQFDNDPNVDQAQDLPPPPSPGQEGTFMPAQVPAATTPSSQSMNQRMRRVEQQITNMQNSDVSTRVDALQTEVQSLRGQLEELTHQLKQVQTQQKNMYSDLDKRLGQSATAASSKKSAATDAPSDTPSPAADTTAADSTATADTGASTDTGSTKSADNQPNVAEEQQIYQTAYNLIKAKKYDEAVNALQGMLKKYPSGQFAANAHYWLGELYGLMSKSDQALTEFTNVVENYPNSPRVSDAQLKVGLIYASQSKWSQARSAFKRVINHYPGTASARLAAEQLKQIKQAGH